MRLLRVLAMATLSAAAVENVRGANFCDLIRCSQESEPVCASNGVSFENACLFQIAKCNNETLKITAMGKCGNATTANDSTPTPTPSPTPTPTPTTTPTPSETPAPTLTPSAAPVAECEMMCIDVYSPVCGTNGKTYTNRCQMRVAECTSRAANATAEAISVASEGECASEAADTPVPSTPITPAITEAPIANDTRGNASLNNATTIPRATDAPIPLCEILCSMVHKPVCGSDGVTYANSCELKRAACKVRKTLTQVSEGECSGADADAASPDEAKCPRACPKIMKPVCGSNGRTYSNQCEFDNAKCTLKIAGLSATEGECVSGDADSGKAPTTAPTKCPTMCVEISQPVCASNGKTYGNPCLFNVAKCQLAATAATEAATLTIASEGECKATAADADAKPATVCPSMCLSVIQPVCGSNGVMYNNDCEFRRAACKLKIANMNYTEGECP